MNNAEVLIKFKGDSSDVDKEVKGLDSSLGKLTKSITLGNLAAKGISKGLQVMTQNMDAAIDRVDTMNNFPRVMKNLGISAEDSQDAINTLSKKLQGLPTTLNDAASAVKIFTSANNDVKKSTDIFLAVNNALIAGGAAAGVQSSALEQLSQAYAKGRPDAMEWRSMLTAMPAQLKQVAQAMGYTSTAVGGDFYQAIQTGVVSMDDFMDTFIKLNQTGVGEFASFEEQARGSTDGIATAITNMKTAFVRGVGDIITKVNESLEPFGGLSGVISSIGQFGEKAFKKIGDILTVVIPKLIKFGQWVSKNKDLILTLTSPILAIVAAMKAYKAIMTVATVVQAAYNAVMLANPVVLIIMAIIGAITLLVAGFMYLWNHCEGFRNFWIGLWEGIKTIVTTAWEWIKNIFTTVIDFVKNNWKSILLFLVNPFAGAFKLLYDNCEGFRNFVNKFVSTIVNFFKSIPAKIKSFATGIVNVFKSIPNQMLNIGKNIVQGLWNGISGLKDWVIGKVASMGKSILKSLKSVLGIHSPSTEFAMIGKFSVLGFTEALQDMSKDVDKQIASTFGLSPQLTGSMQNSFSPNVEVYNNVNIEQDPLGQMVRTIKTYSGGSPNDYNYGAGV